ncbi:MAG: stalk domain-containing protein [Caldisericota bacterium]|nr:stalk domain-containing protein [Caldisericota bacterium]
MKKFFIFVIIFIILLNIIPAAHGESDSLRLLSLLPYQITSIHTDGSLILAGTLNGFFVSTDSGSHFSERDTGLSDLHITGIAFFDGNIFLGTENAGAYISYDLGKHWESLMNKLDCPTISSISSDENLIYVTSLCSGFYISSDSGQTWVKRNNGLPTVETTSFVKISSEKYFLGTRQFGLFYSNTVGDECSWKNVLTDYSITSLSYLGNYLFVGTTEGFFKGNIENNNFQKIQFIGGSPYVSYVAKTDNKIFVAFLYFGLFGSVDGSNFYKVGGGVVPNPDALFFDSKNNALFIGDVDGNLFYFDTTRPYLQCSEQIDVGSVPQGSSVEKDIFLVNLGGGILKGTVSGPYFIKFDTNSFTAAGKLHFLIDTSALSIGSFKQPVSINSNGGNKTVYISFKVIQAPAINIKLKIDSPIAYVNGKRVDLDAAPFIVKEASRTLVPIRFISETFGATVEWDGNERKVTIKKSATTHHPSLLIEMWIDRKTLRVNLEEKTIDVAPLIILPGRTMVPIRFITETFGSTVQWNGNTREITIYYTP